jgi:transcriptional regulator with XRE-family HTH domain
LLFPLFQCVDVHRAGRVEFVEFVNPAAVWFRFYTTVCAREKGDPAEARTGRVSLISVDRRNVEVMDSNNDVSEFLASRRAKVTPEQAGLPSGGNRRVPGLRRGEVAVLAGVSVEYYSKIERGIALGVSDSVLSALARALQLDEAEHAHLLDLIQAVNDRPRTQRRQPKQQLRPGVQLVLDAITDAPAFVRNGRADILGINILGRALYSEMFVTPGRPVNHARFIFLDPRAIRFYPGWPKAADDIVAILRSEAGKNPFDRALTDLVGELSTRSEDFRTRWAAHNVRHHFTGLKHFHHPVVGDIHLMFEAMQLSADDGLSLLVYNAAPGTAAADSLQLLSAWAATHDIDNLATENVSPRT